MIKAENKKILEETISQLSVFEEELRKSRKEIFSEKVSSFVEIFPEILAKRGLKEIVLKKIAKNLQEIINLAYLARTNLSQKHYLKALLSIENLIARIEERLNKERESDYGLLENLKKAEEIIKGSVYSV